MKRATVRIVYNGSEMGSPHRYTADSLREALEYVEHVFSVGYFVMKYGGGRHVFVPASKIIHADVYEEAEAPDDNN
jgi:hypothetical protein